MYLLFNAPCLSLGMCGKGGNCTDFGGGWVPVTKMFPNIQALPLVQETCCWIHSANTKNEPPCLF